MQTGIVFLGGSLSLNTIYETNSDFFLWISFFVLIAFGSVIFLGRLLGVNEKLSFLLASGTAVCGGTAIASVAPTIKAKPEEDVDRTSSNGKASSVQFIHFHFTDNQIKKFKSNDISIELGINHDEYSHMTKLTKESVRSLSTDFI